MCGGEQRGNYLWLTLAETEFRGRLESSCQGTKLDLSGAISFDTW